MEFAREEFMVPNDLTQVIKGKRTKRQRSSSPPHKAAGAVSCSSSSGFGDVVEGGERGVEEYYYGSNSSHTSCSEVYEGTEEEEDMANCLILLAQGDGIWVKNIDESRTRIEKSSTSSRKFSQISTTATTNKAGFYVYECKTCNRSFPSFQALGGHRASHKKPKIEEKKATPPPPPPVVMDDDLHNNNNINLEECQLSKSSNSSPDNHHHLHHNLPEIFSINKQQASFIGSNNNNTNNNKAKIHECSICGSEFTSGQALGGHMRRHRANTVNNNNNHNNTNTIIGTSSSIINGCIADSNQVKPRTILSLDLNLPAPEDDHHLHRESKFQFVSPQQPLVFSATPALVDCHY